MRIRNIEIANYRSIKHLKLMCEPLVVLLGPNNHGKSNILGALEFALTSTTKPTATDFNAGRGEDDSLWVELEFDGLTEQEKRTWQKYLRHDESFRFRKTAVIASNDSVEVGYCGYVVEPTEWWLKNDSVKPLSSSREEVGRTPLRDLVPASGRLTQAMITEAQQQFITQNQSELKFEIKLESGPLLGQKNVVSGVLPDFYLVPAVRELSEEMKIKNTTVFGKLLNRAVKEMAERDPKFREVKTGLDELVNSLNRSGGGPDSRPSQLRVVEAGIQSELEDWGVKVEIEVVPPMLERLFELGTTLHLDDGIRTLAAEKGHGLQRAVIFALLRAWAKTLRSADFGEKEVSPRAASETVIFAMEEPELFLHPHAQRRLSRALDDIAASADHQVFVCSHSTHFVDLNKYKSICLVSKPTADQGTTVRQATEDLFEGDGSRDRKDRFHMAHWVNPDRGEMFFAKKVVFVEGETEKTIIPYLADRLGCFDHEVSLVDCGSKFNLPLYMAIANAFCLEYLVIHDEDPLPNPIPDEWNEDRIKDKETTNAFNSRIATACDSQYGSIRVLSPDFERFAGVSKTQGKEKGKPIAALDYFKDLESIPSDVENLARSVYATEIRAAASNRVPE